jgi:hypothetical protein
MESILREVKRFWQNVTSAMVTMLMAKLIAKFQYAHCMASCPIEIVVVMMSENQFFWSGEAPTGCWSK